MEKKSVTSVVYSDADSKCLSSVLHDCLPFQHCKQSSLSTVHRMDEWIKGNIFYP